MFNNAATGPESPRSSRDHDLRNLLYLVTSFTQLVRDGVSGSVTPQQKEFLGHVLDCARRAQEVLKPTGQRSPNSISMFAGGSNDSPGLKST